MRTSQNRLVLNLLVIGAALAVSSATNVQSFRYKTYDESADTYLSTDACLDTVIPVDPFSQVYQELEKLNWDPLRIESAIREYWQTNKSFAYSHEGPNGENVTTLTTSCHRTAPWIITALLKLQTRHEVTPELYVLPADDQLIVYNNTERSHSTLANPPIQSIRDFISSRPSNESILLQVDMCLLAGEHGCYFIDHHFMIHAYNGQINVYQSWQDHFTLIDWMTDSGSFSSRYPMTQDTFLDYFETILAPAKEKDEIRKRQEAVWAILGRSETITWKVNSSDNTETIDDVVVHLLYHQWLCVLVTHWPSQL